jgi:hypothetical protein
MLDYLMMCKSYLYAKLDGSMDLDERTSRINTSLTTGTKVVDQFNNDPQMFVFLISTKAGGVGLNIVSANKVYKPRHLIPSNPAESFLTQTGTQRTTSKHKTAPSESANAATSKYSASSPKAPSKKLSTPAKSTNNNKPTLATTPRTSVAISRASKVNLMENSLASRIFFHLIRIDRF